MPVTAAVTASVTARGGIVSETASVQTGRVASVGSRVLKIDGEEKVRGSARFVDDLTLPGMLIGAILRSPHPHARIRGIDTTRARRLPGVKAVITAADTPGIKYVHMGPPLDDRLPLQSEKVRYVGDEVAAVAAVDESTAVYALSLIDVDYEELEPVFDPEDALVSSVTVHDDKPGNIAARVEWVFGDPEAAFAGAHLVLEDRFTTQGQSHCVLEPHGTIAEFSAGSLTVWTSTQSSYFVRKELAHVLGLGEHQVRVMAVHCAGAFGGRSKICDDEAIAAVLSKVSGRPVKIILTREEEITTSRVRHPFIIYLKSAFGPDGRLVARDVRVVNDNGSYNNVGPAISGYAGMVAASLYRVRDVRYEGLTVYTNKQFGGPYRGFGSPQMTFALETHMDEAAYRLNIDPAEIRIRNSNLPGDTTACGWHITSCGLKECIDTVKQAIEWQKPSEKGRGKGLACTIHVGGGARIFRDGDFSSAVVQIDLKGHAVVFSGVVDVGTWITTSLCQIVSDVLCVPMDRVSCVSMDTATTPADLGSWGSKTAFMAGNAAKRAAEDARQQLLDSAAVLLDAPVEFLSVEDGAIVSTLDRSVSLTIEEAVAGSGERVGTCVLGRGHYDSPTELINRVTGIANISATYAFGAHAFEVEVDEATGVVRVLRVVAAHDVGRPLNPIAVEGQIEGAVAQGIGFALCEEQRYQEGRVQNTSLHDQRPVTSLDVPPIDVRIVLSDEEEGPFGAKGVGESGLIPCAPAIANAVFDAVGVRFRDLPLTPERVLAALQSRT